MISIIIPTRNEEKIIESTLKRLKDGIKKFQYEIIVVDGGSSDKTLEIVKKYTDKIVLQKEGPHKTIGQGKNLGAEIAKGQYLLFMDADVYMPDADYCIENILKIFSTNDKMVGVAISQKVMPEYETFSDKVILYICNAYLAMVNNVFGSGAAPGEFQFIKTDIFRKLGGYDERLVVAEDNEFFSRLSKIGKTHFDRQIFFYHTGRRAHKIGWPRLLFSWWSNYISVIIFKKSVSKEWKVIR